MVGHRPIKYRGDRSSKLAGRLMLEKVSVDNYTQSKGNVKT